MPEQMPPHAIAIIGFAGRFPGARSLDDFWRNISDGIETLDTLSDAELDAAGVPESLRTNPHYVRKGTALEEADHFDAGFFGLSPREAQILDPQHRIFLECAWEALEHAGHSARRSEQSVGVYAGASMNSYLINQLLRDPAFIANVGGYQLMLGNDKDFLCTRVSYKLDLHGPSLTIQTACSTSLVAVVVACQALNRGECDMALAGGVSVTFPQRAGYLYEEGMILSPDGHCRPFDAQARGTRGGAGAGIVVLKRLRDALADRDTIHAVIRGAAINNDGAGKAGYTAPSVDGQIEAIATAQALAGIDPRTITYIETHGTGTPLGDPIEIAALTRVFRASTPDVGFCRLGSLKANLGHLDAAAGVAGLIKTVLALKHREIPPLVNFSTPNPQLELDRSPFVGSAQGNPWESEGLPRRAGVSSFGIGGTNAHVVLEEAPQVPVSAPAGEAHVIVLSAMTATALEQATSNLAGFLDGSEDLPLADVAWTLQIGRQDFAHRRVVVVKDKARAAEALRQPERAPVWTAIHQGDTRPVAFLFSGQGSQYAGMGAGLYRGESAYREAIDRCAALLEPQLGLDIRDVIFAEHGDAAINETRFTQPALFATEYALASLWMQWGVIPDAMLGHSIGEYVAAHLAGVLSLEDAISVVAARGRLMHALPRGTMAAVHLPAAELGRWLGDGVEIAAVNAHGLCTISGPPEPVADVLNRLNAEGIQSVSLQTSHAFHSGMMEAALAPFTSVLQDVALSPPAIPYVSNVTGTWITSEEATSPAYYATQLRRAVQFEAGIRTLTADPALFLLEVGPGNALTSMARMTVGKDRAMHLCPSLPHVREARADVEAVLEAAGRLWLSGVKLDWRGMHAGAAPRRVPLPTYPFERHRHWVEAAPAAAPQALAQEVPQSPGQEQRDICDWFWLPSWQRSLPLSAHSTRAHSGEGRWLFFADDSAECEALTAELSRLGVAVISVFAADDYRQLSATGFTIAPDRREHYDRLLKAVLASEHKLAAVVHAWNTAHVDESVASDPQRGRSLAFCSMLHLAQALADIDDSGTLPVLIVSADREMVLGVETLRPERSLLLGPLYAMPLEVPFLRCRNIDLWSTEWHPEGAGQIATSLLAEAASPESEQVVAYRGGYRWVPKVEALRLEAPVPAMLPLRQRGTYLITGGTGGIGLTVARELATTVQARLVLTARTALPERSRWNELLADGGVALALKKRLQEILDLEALGSEVMIAAADVADEQQMSAVIAAARERFGAIHGVMHAAGTLALGTMREKTREQIEAALRPKVEGTLVLDKLLAGCKLDFMMLFSSISTAVGSWGMSDYTAANAFLDAFAKAGVCRASTRAIAIGWDGWSDVGFAAVMGEHRNQPWMRTAIRPHEGMDALKRALGSSLTHAYVTRRVMPEVLRDAEMLARWMRDATGDQESPPAVSMEQHAPQAALQARPALATPYVAPATREEEKLAEMWSELLGIDNIGVHDNFFELGGHSLLGTRVIARIHDKFGARLALRDVFDAPTIHRLAERICAVASNAAALPQVEDDREELVF